MYGISGEVNFYHNILDNYDSLKLMKNVFSDTKENNIIVNNYVGFIQHTNDNCDCFYSLNIDNHKYYIVFYGNLFNKNDVISELSSNGFKVKPNVYDIVLKSYILWKDDCLNHFNGSFSFAIWDDKEKQLFIARDRLGVKPFFYAIINNSLIFSSKLESILNHKYVDAVADENSIAEIMYLGPGRTPGCGVFKDVKELKPATCGYFTKSGIKIKKYWTLKDRENNDTFNVTVEKIQHLLNDSIKNQTNSDEVCTFLSGGLDSSLISSYVNEKYKKQGKVLQTYSVTYENNDKYFKANNFQPNSDSQFISEMKQFLGCDHSLITLTNEDLANALFDAVDARDLPGMADVDSSLLLFCKEVCKKNNIAVSGECADEIFGGYPWYRNKNIRMTVGFPWAQSTEYRTSFLKSDILLPDAHNYIYSRYNDTIVNTSKLSNISPLEAKMKEMMKLNLEWFMQTLLDRSERMANYNNMEIRVPFCDYRIVEYLYTVPWEFKDYKNYEKGLLREAVKSILPSNVLWRKKSPYPKTHNPEYLKIVSSMLQDILCDTNSKLFDFIDRSKLEELLNSENTEPWYGQLMTTPQTIAYFIQIDYWLKKYNVSIR